MTDIVNFNAWSDFFALPEIEDILLTINKVVDTESRQYTVYPPFEYRFRALQETNPRSVKVVIVGQDPYHGDNQANGLAFSVPDGVRIPPSLRNIFKEISRDFSVPLPDSGDLIQWARQGVLLLNTVLTVRKGIAGSHRNIGWETFTDRLIYYLSDRCHHLVFMLWGNDAQAKAGLIDGSRHLILRSVHPSPLSAYRGFIGCGHFSAANQFLKDAGCPTVDWIIHP